MNSNYSPDPKIAKFLSHYFALRGSFLAQAILADFQTMRFKNFETADERRWTSQRVGRLCRLEATGVQMDADGVKGYGCSSGFSWG